MLVDHIVYYLIHREGLKWRDQDYKARGVVKCVKDEPFNGNFEVRLSGKVGSYNYGTRSRFLAALWPHMANRICDILGGSNACIVPIPNSGATKTGTGRYKTLTYAQSIAAHSKGRLTAVDCLRWNKAQPPQHKAAGRRDPETRYANMVLTATPPAPVILFDDFFTSGSSLIAAYWRLQKVGRAPERAFVIGRTTDIQQEFMTKWGSEDLVIPRRSSLFDD